MKLGTFALISLLMVFSNLSFAHDDEAISVFEWKLTDSVSGNGDPAERCYRIQKINGKTASPPVEVDSSNCRQPKPILSAFKIKIADTVAHNGDKRELCYQVSVKDGKVLNLGNPVAYSLCYKGEKLRRKLIALRAKYLKGIRGAGSKLTDAQIIRWLDAYVPLTPNSLWKTASTLRGSVFDPVTGAVETHPTEPVYNLGGSYIGNAGFAGVYNPITGAIQWQRDHLWTNYYGVLRTQPYTLIFNPESLRIELQVAHAAKTFGGDFLGALPYTGVFNPLSGEVEWRLPRSWGNLYSGLRYAPLYAVFNPLTGETEWKEN